MSDGPYRDIGSGFVRLSGLEAPRRAPSSIKTVEDVLRALLDNSLNAGAKRIFISTSLSAKRYRTLHVIDDGQGIPETHTEAIFEPGVTSRPLDPGTTGLPASGLSLYHIKNLALETSLPSRTRPTAIRITLDTRKIPERTLQSTSRTSRTNLLATAKTFARENPHLTLTLGTPSEVLASLIKNNIILQSEEGLATDFDDVHFADHGSSSVSREYVTFVYEEVGRLGFDISRRTLTRILCGEIQAAGLVSGDVSGSSSASEADVVGDFRESGVVGVSLRLGGRDRERISDIIGEAARAEYLSLGEIRFESSGGKIYIKAEILQPEGEYDDRDL